MRRRCRVARWSDPIGVPLRDRSRTWRGVEREYRRQGESSSSGGETAGGESVLVDDQAEWLDDETVLYGMVDGRVWQRPADGSGAPRRFLDHALSAAVIAARRCS